jgi:cysteinyl-tRNA synthetase
LTFNDEVLLQSEKALERLTSAFRPELPGSKGATKDILETLAKQMEETQDSFIKNMDDDFNSAGALGSMFDLVRVINQARAAGATNEQLQPAQNKLRELTNVFGLVLAESNESTSQADPFIDLLIELRSSLRNDKLWSYSDLIRDKLKELGVTVEDSKDGTTWRWD